MLSKTYNILSECTNYSKVGLINNCEYYSRICDSALSFHFSTSVYIKRHRSLQDIRIDGSPVKPVYQYMPRLVVCEP